MTAREFFGEWYKCINPIELDKVVKQIKPLYEHYQVYPYYKEIFNAFKYCDYNNLKVVFLGLDPYNDGSATGIAFANRENTKALSPSLKVIKDCLEENYTPTEQKFDVTLMNWEKQGVLMLNSALTVETDKPKSHSMIWRKFISSFLLCYTIYFLFLPHFASLHFPHDVK